MPGSCSSVCPDLFFNPLVRDLGPLMCLACFDSRQLLRKAFSQAVTLHYRKRKLSASALTHLPTSCQGDRSWYRVWTDRVSCQMQSTRVCTEMHLLATDRPVRKPKHLFSHCLINITTHFIDRGFLGMLFVSFQTICIFIQYRTCSVAGIWKLYCLNKHIFL